MSQKVDRELNILKLSNSKQEIFFIIFIIDCKCISSFKIVQIISSNFKFEFT